jgi:hypothetical protein
LRLDHSVITSLKPRTIITEVLLQDLQAWPYFIMHPARQMTFKPLHHRFLLKSRQENT